MKQYGGEVTADAVGTAAAAACASLTVGILAPVCGMLARTVTKMGMEKFVAYLQNSGVDGACQGMRVCQ